MANRRDNKLCNALLVVAKRPTPGRTKTRLVPPLTLVQAAALYEQFLQDTLDLIRRVPDIQPVIAYLPAKDRDYFTGIAPDFDYLLQTGQNLGARLDAALTHYLTLGYRHVVIMNSDGPNLPHTYLKQAFDALSGETDVVLGPCEDGGYYLIGLKAPAPRLLHEVEMSTPTVMRDTLALAAEERLHVTTLPTWYDVDQVADLRRLLTEIKTVPAEICAHTRSFLAANPALQAAIWKAK
jgi:uncharacterized protein